jgi:hypothetical protein
MQLTQNNYITNHEFDLAPWWQAKVEWQADDPLARW